MALRAARPEVDASAVEVQVKRIHTALTRIANINRPAGGVRANTIAIQTDAEAFRDDIGKVLMGEYQHDGKMRNRETREGKRRVDRC
jgi:hypothetical protein